MQPGSEQRVGQPQPRNLIQEEGQGEAEDSIFFSSPRRFASGFHLPLSSNAEAVCSVTCGTGAWFEGEFTGSAQSTCLQTSIEFIYESLTMHRLYWINLLQTRGDLWETASSPPTHNHRMFRVGPSRRSSFNPPSTRLGCSKPSQTWP
nr:uncharacterized protein LOC110357443 isoform X2 [Columba livia]